MNKKSIGPVVATALLLVVAVFAVINFQTWFTSYQSNILTNLEQKSNNKINEIEIETISKDKLYIKSKSLKNISINKININKFNCINNKNIKYGMNEFNISSCLTNITLGINEITVYTSNEILTKKLYISSIPATSPPPNCLSLQTGLIGLWHFDNNLIDNSGSNNNARDSTGVTFNSSSKLGSHAAEFSGTNQHLNISNIDFSSGGSFIAWMKFDDLSTDRVLIGSDVGGNEEFQLWMDNGAIDKFAITVYDGGWQSVYGTIPLSIGTWYFVGYTFNGTTAKLYVNGVQDGTDLNRVIVDRDSGDLWIGETTQGLKDMSGLIDELAIYNRALTSSEISQIYSENNLGKPICNN